MSYRKLGLLIHKGGQQANFRRIEKLRQHTDAFREFFTEVLGGYDMLRQPTCQPEGNEDLPRLWGILEEVDRFTSWQLDLPEWAPLSEKFSKKPNPSQKRLYYVMTACEDACCRYARTHLNRQISSRIGDAMEVHHEASKLDDVRSIVNRCGAELGVVFTVTPRVMQQEEPPHGGNAATYVSSFLFEEQVVDMRSANCLEQIEEYSYKVKLRGEQLTDMCLAIALRKSGFMTELSRSGPYSTRDAVSWLRTSGLTLIDSRHEDMLTGGPTRKYLLWTSSHFVASKGGMVIDDDREGPLISSEMRSGNVSTTSRKTRQNTKNEKSANVREKMPNFQEKTFRNDQFASYTP